MTVTMAMRVIMAVRVSVRMRMVMCVAMAMIMIVAVVVMAVVIVMAVGHQPGASHRHRHMGGADLMAHHAPHRQFPRLLGFQMPQALHDHLRRAAQINERGQKHVSGDAADGVKMKMAHGARI